MTNPYTDKEIIQEGTNDTYVLRTFNANVSEDELIWHRDHNNRKIQVLSGESWKLQLDDELPKNIEVGKEYYIPKGNYHRLLKGKGNLVIRFRKHINTRL